MKNKKKLWKKLDKTAKKGVVMYAMRFIIWVRRIVTLSHVYGVCGAHLWSFWGAAIACLVVSGYLKCWVLTGYCCLPSGLAFRVFAGPGVGLHNMGELKYECAVAVDYVCRCCAFNVKGWLFVLGEAREPESEVF